jgi:DNA-directed RNA polymerase subunit omega
MSKRQRQGEARQHVAGCGIHRRAASWHSRSAATSRRHHGEHGEGKGPWSTLASLDFHPRNRYALRFSPDFAGTAPEQLLAMIDALKSDEIVQKMGGRFKLCALIQRRLKELIIDGARPLVERNGRTDLELVIDEIMQDKITCDYSETGYAQVFAKVKKSK